MSYDLMVFASESAPKERAKFLEWFEAQAEWSEDHSYDTPDVSTPQLRAWFMEMIESFPALNGPHSMAELPKDESLPTDYCVGRHVIYAAFRWSKAEAAYERVFALAAKHAVGFFDVSSDHAEVWLPDGKGDLALSSSE